MSCNFLQNQVKTARVMVVGCGALGNEVLKNLVLMGVEHLVVVDFDIVEIGNLTRSVLFTIECCGRATVFYESCCRDKDHFW